MSVHLVSRSIFPLQPLASYEACSWLWTRLRAAFPDATDCTLMPNGVHLISESSHESEARRVLVGVLGGFGRRYSAGLWEPVPDPAVIPNRKHHRRHSRYVALNPSRDGLVSDPLEWCFSSYRDVMGAAVDPWVDAQRLAAAHGMPTRGFRDDYHRYVSGDPTVAVAGTPTPIAATPAAVSVHPLRRIQLAAAAATRRHPDAVRHRGPTRDLFVALARDQGWAFGPIARACAMSRRQVLRIDTTAAALQAGRTCLGDDRLLVATADLATSPGIPDLRARATRDLRRDRLARRPHTARMTHSGSSVRRGGPRLHE